MGNTAVAFVMLLWLLRPVMPLREQPVLRIDMISVGDGSCYVLRSGGSTVVFDAGSSSDLNAGRRSIIPAMRRLGVRSIDAIAVTHANLDHYSAVLELVNEFEVGEVLVTPQFLHASQANPVGSVAFVVNGVTDKGVPVSAATAGLQRRIGECTWTWLHPGAGDTFKKVNDESMVVRVECAGRSVLLCGDIQREAMAMLMGPADRPNDMIDADIVELPHHGSHTEIAEFFIQRVSPIVAMQSTAWKRWQNDAWGPSLAHAERLVTACDGACWIEIDHDGSIRTGRFLQP
jgi:competence protein ComEC